MGRLAVALACAVALVAPAAARATPDTQGSWTAPFNLGIIAIHSAVLHDGRVLLYRDPQSGWSALGSRVALYDSTTGSITDASLQQKENIFCSGMSFLPDGRLFVAGGQEYGTTRDTQSGAAETSIFEPSTNGWSDGPEMAQPRWYPSTIELGSGHVLISGGVVNSATKVAHIEDYDRATNSLAVLPSTADKAVGNYPRLVLLQSGKVLMAGPARGTQTFNPATNSWAWVGNMSVGRSAGSAVLLPGLKKVLAVGGSSGGVVQASAEILDTSVNKPAWRPTAPMAYPRVHANAVLLPDGKVLVVGGGTGGTYTNPVYASELFDPVAETWTTMASQTAPRIYHSTAVLLPNGTVLSAGMDKGTYQNTGEIYFPPYLFNGARPTITGAPSSVGYGQAFTITTPAAANISRVALIKAPAVTHGLNFDQRYVDLAFAQDPSGGALDVTGPAGANQAPPGWYMLFIVDGNGVPSVAAWVDVG